MPDPRPRCRRRGETDPETFFADNVKARLLLPTVGTSRALDRAKVWPEEPSRSLSPPRAKAWVPIEAPHVAVRPPRRPRGWPLPAGRASPRADLHSPSSELDRRGGNAWVSTRNSTRCETPRGASRSPRLRPRLSRARSSRSGGTSMAGGGLGAAATGCLSPPSPGDLRAGRVGGQHRGAPLRAGAGGALIVTHSAVRRSLGGRNLREAWRDRRSLLPCRARGRIHSPARDIRRLSPRRSLALSFACGPISPFDPPLPKLHDLRRLCRRHSTFEALAFARTSPRPPRGPGICRTPWESSRFSRRPCLGRASPERGDWPAFFAPRNRTHREVERAGRSRRARASRRDRRRGGRANS